MTDGVDLVCEDGKLFFAYRMRLPQPAVSGSSMLTDLLTKRASASIAPFRPAEVARWATAAAHAGTFEASFTSDEHVQDFKVRIWRCCWFLPFVFSSLAQKTPACIGHADRRQTQPPPTHGDRVLWLLPWKRELLRSTCCTRAVCKRRD